MKQEYNSSRMSVVYSDIASVPVAFVLIFPLPNAELFNANTSSIFLSIFLLSILPTIFKVFVTKQMCEGRDNL
jgi:hypothetical protein